MLCVVLLLLSSAANALRSIVAAVKCCKCSAKVTFLCWQDLEAARNDGDAEAIAKAELTAQEAAKQAEAEAQEAADAKAKAEAEEAEAAEAEQAAQKERAEAEAAEAKVASNSNFI